MFGSGSKLWKFLTAAPEWFGPLKNKNHCIVCTIGLLHQIRLLNGNSNFRLQFHHSKFFSSGCSHPKLLGFQLHSPDCFMWNSFRLNFNFLISFLWNTVLLQSNFLKSAACFRKVSAGFYNNRFVSMQTQWTKSLS